MAQIISSCAFSLEKHNIPSKFQVTNKKLQLSQQYPWSPSLIIRQTKSAPPIPKERTYERSSFFFVGMSDLDSILGLKPSARQITDTESSGTEIVNEDDEESVIDCDFALEEKENALLKASCERKCEGSMQNDSTESDKSHSLDNASNLHSHTSANSEQKSVNTSDCTDQVVYNSTNMTDNSQFTQTLSFVQHNVQVLPGVAGFTWKMVAESCAEGSANRGKILYSSGSVFPLQIDSKSQTTNPAKECTDVSKADFVLNTTVSSTQMTILYTVQIHWELALVPTSPQNNALDFSPVLQHMQCSCPDSRPGACKHIAAVLIHLVLLSGGEVPGLNRKCSPFRCRISSSHSGTPPHTLSSHHSHECSNSTVFNSLNTPQTDDGRSIARKKKSPSGSRQSRASKIEDKQNGDLEMRNEQNLPIQHCDSTVSVQSIDPKSCARTEFDLPQAKFLGPSQLRRLSLTQVGASQEEYTDIQEICTLKQLNHDKSINSKVQDRRNSDLVVNKLIEKRTIEYEQGQCLKENERKLHRNGSIESVSSIECENFSYSLLVHSQKLKGKHRRRVQLLSKIIRENRRSNRRSSAAKIGESFDPNNPRSKKVSIANRRPIFGAQNDQVHILPPTADLLQSQTSNLTSPQENASQCENKLKDQENFKDAVFDDYKKNKDITSSTATSPEQKLYRVENVSSPSLPCTQKRETHVLVQDSDPEDMCHESYQSKMRLDMVNKRKKRREVQSEHPPQKLRRLRESSNAKEITVELHKDPQSNKTAKTLVPPMRTADISLENKNEPLILSLGSISFPESQSQIEECLPTYGNAFSLGDPSSQQSTIITKTAYQGIAADSQFEIYEKDFAWQFPIQKLNHTRDISSQKKKSKKFKHKEPQRKSIAPKVQPTQSTKLLLKNAKQQENQNRLENERRQLAWSLWFHNTETTEYFEPPPSLPDSMDESSFF